MAKQRGLNPKGHLATERALATLRNEGILFVRGRSNCHNVRMLDPESKVPVAAFDHWLQDTLEGAEFEKRAFALAAQVTAPSARMARPREEILLPLMVALGAAERDLATRYYHEDTFFGSGSVSSFTVYQ